MQDPIDLPTKESVDNLAIFYLNGLYIYRHDLRISVKNNCPQSCFSTVIIHVTKALSSVSKKISSNDVSKKNVL